MIVILLILLTFLLPLSILRSFSRTQKTFVFLIIFGQIALMLFLHYQLVHTTAFPIVRDDNIDAQKYFNETESFSNAKPFSVTIGQIKRAVGTRFHFGYQYILATLRTISSKPILSIRILKILLFLTSLSCLARVWRVDYGDKLAIRAFIFMGLLFHPAFYYSYRNFKDSLILSLCMFIMAMLDIIFRPKQNRIEILSHKKTMTFWCLVFLLLLALSTIRLYIVVLIIASITMHVIMSSRMDLKTRVLFIVLLIVTGLILMQSSLISNMMEMKKGRGVLSGFDPYLLFHSIVAPLPWQYTADPPLLFFHCVYLLCLPYTLYVLFRHFWNNINWRLFMYMMVIYTTGLTGSEARKRIVIIPIMATWILTHLAYNQKKKYDHYENETDTDLYGYEYNEEYVLAERAEGYD